MPQLLDSGNPGNVFDRLKLDRSKPQLLSDPTWRHIHERYELRGELGEGGQGLVLLVKEREKPHRRLAIKVYHENTDAARRLFDHECRVLASDHLPQDLVVGYIQCVSEPNLQPYLILEHIDGKPISDYVASARSMSVIEKINLWEKLCRSLHRLHQCHLVFGDLSPKNVLVEKDEVIRFIDLAGSKLLKKAYTGSQDSQNIGTPGMMPDAWNTGEARTALWTDIYAASAIGFLILTGHDKGEFPVAKWDVELQSHHIPAEVRRVVLKGLREKDLNKSEDPTLYPTAEHLANEIANWRNNRIRRRALFQQLVVTLMMLLIVGGIGAVGWVKYQGERQAYDLRTLQELQRQVERLPNVTHPGVAKFVDQGFPSGSDGESQSGSIDLRPAIAALRQALAVSRDVEWAESMRESLGEVLNDSPWLKSAKAIDKQRTNLAKQFLKLKEELAAGQTDELQPRMALLHRDLARLAQDNTLALPAEQRRMEYERLAKSVAEELHGKDAFIEIARSAQDSQRLLDDGKWHDAELHFGSCTQRLTEWLSKNETAEQRAGRVKADQETVAVLEQEKEQLKTDAARVKQTLEEKEAAIGKLNENLAKLGTDAANARIAEQKATEALKSEQSKLVSLQKTYNGVNGKLTQAKLDLAAARPKLETFDATVKQVEALTKERDHLKSNSEDLGRQVAAFKDALAKNRPKTAKLIHDAGALKPGERRVLTIEGVEFAFCWIPPTSALPGKFMMGTPTIEDGHQPDESQVEVTLTQGFWMLETEVTQQIYFAVTKAKPWMGKVKDGDAYPACYISWTEANDFCEQLTKAARSAGILSAKEMIGLPTEAQWEWAARSGTTTAYFSGNNESKLGDFAWYDKNAWDIGEKYAHQAGLKKPNAWGLLDISGNVWEWTSDYYDKVLPGGTNPSGPLAGSSRVLRGGSFYRSASYCRVGSRGNGGLPYVGSNIGFRVVCVCE